MVQSEGPEEGGACDCGGLLSVIVGCGDKLFESPPDRLWLICGGVSAGLALRRNQNESTALDFCAFHLINIFLFSEVK